MNKIKLKFLFLFFIFLFTNNIISQTFLEKELKNFIENQSEYDINNFILDKVINNRVVIIADEGHGNYIYMRTIINFFNSWIEKLNEDFEKQEIPRKLYLVLESDSVQINSIYKYFVSKNPYDLLKPELIWGYQFTTAMIEFYDDLRKINDRVNFINKNLPDNNKISFKIFGPEKVLDLNDWSIEKRDNYFIRERDEYSSNQIINLLEKDSSAKAIIFYGGQHLVTIKTQKMQTNSELGYFIGHYLYEYFKNRGGYYSIDQVSTWQNMWLNESYRCSQNNYAIENSIFDGAVMPIRMYPQFTDASLILFDKFVKQAHISGIWSNNLANCFLNSVDNFTNFKNDIYREILSSWFYYLSVMSGSNFITIDFKDSVSVASEINKWKEWIRNKEINFAEEIINHNIFKKRIKLYEDSEGSNANRYEYELSNILSAKVWYSHGAASSIKVKEYYKYIQNYSEPIIAENLINLLWIGTENEKARALEYLRNTFSSDFNSAKDWTEWWRNSEY